MRHDTAAFNNLGEDETVRRQLKFEEEETETDMIGVQRLGSQSGTSSSRRNTN